MAGTKMMAMISKIQSIDPMKLKDGKLMVWEVSQLQKEMMAQCLLKFRWVRLQS